MYYSKTTLIGRIVRPKNWPEALRIKSAANGNKTTTFMLSVKTKVGDKEQDDWHYIVAFNRVAESCKEYLKDGSDVLVEGRFRKRKAGPEGEERERWELIASSVTFGDNVWSEQTKQQQIYRGGNRSENW